MGSLNGNPETVHAMGSELSSVLLGTSGLSLAAIIALALCYSRSEAAPEHIGHIRRVATVAVVLQLAHFGEEYRGEFYLQFPALLGLAPWSEQFFVSFNVFWLFVWGLAIAGIARFPGAAAFPLWFLAIASAANGIVHPLLALAVAGYFPGLWSSPLVGFLGVVLLTALGSATRTGGKAPHDPVGPEHG